MVQIDGYISTLMKGKNGFGYDPIFIPKGQENYIWRDADSLQKYKIDHQV